MLLMIDNYDSFTYNLVQYLRGMDTEVKVARNTELTVEQALALAPAGIVISPGPGHPQEAGISVPLIQRGSGVLLILGVCLGHQAIGLAFGGRIVKAARIMHGKVSHVTHNGRDLFADIKSPLKATRYHSLAIEAQTLPACLEVTATAEDGEIMAIRHREHCTFGVQFHPESVLTTAGKRILANFLAMTAADSE